MTETADGCTVSVPEPNRSTARPKGEKQADTPCMQGEASQQALVHTGDDTGSILPGTGTVEPSAQVETMEIVRATMRVPVEVWRLAEDREAHASMKCGRRSKCRACELAYEMTVVQAQCASAANLVARTLEREDGKAFDEAKLLQEKVKDWPGKALNVYNLARSAHPEVSAGIMSAVSKMVADKWHRERFAVLVKNERSAARWKAATMPIPLRKADVKLVECDERDLFELHFTLKSGRTGRGKQFMLPLRAKDARMYRDLRAIARGNFRMGQLQLDKDRRGKWALRIAYKRQVVKQQGDVLAAINRGITCILAIVTESGEQIIYDGHDIAAHLRATQEQRKRYQRGYTLSGRKGHGRKRALRPTQAIQDKSGRWRRTRMQTIAREAATWLSKRGVTRVLIDDLAGIRDGAVELLDGGKPIWDMIQSWPYFEMGSRLESCLQEVGIAVEKRPVKFASRDCPKCGHRHETRQVGRRFQCTSCKFNQHIDIVFGKNLITRERA